MPLDFSHLQGETAQTGNMDFSALGAIPAVGGGVEEDSTSMLGAAGRGAVGMIPLGEQAYAGIESLVDETPYAAERKELETDIAADKENHPGSRLAGQAAGVIAPALLTGGTSIPGGVVAEGALYGAGFGAGNAIDTLAEGGTGAQAAGDVAMGTVTGAIGGAGGKAIGNVISKAAKPFVNSQDEILAEATAGILGGNSRQIRALPGKNPVETLTKMGRDMTKYTVDGEPLIAMTDQMPARLNKFLKLQEQSGRTIGDTIQNANVAPMSTKPIAEELGASLKFATPDDQAQMKAVIDQMAKYGDPQGNISFGKLHLLKRELGDQAFEGQGNSTLQSAYHVISDIQDRELEKVASTINKPAFDEAKAAYYLTSRAIPLLRTTVSKEVGSKTNLLIPGAALLSGHPMVAAGALMKNRLAQMGSGAVFKGAQALPENAGAIAAGLPGKIGGQVAPSTVQNMGEDKKMPAGKPTGGKTEQNKLNLDHPAMAQWKNMFQQNAANAKNPGEVEKAHAVTDFILSQRDPGYAAAKQKMADEPMPDMTAAVPPVQMAEGGVVPEKKDNDYGTLVGLRNVLRKNAGVETPKPETLPSGTKTRFHEPFNTDLADKLREFMANKEKDDAESR